MRIAYMDEAGVSSPKEEPFLTVAGIIVEGDSTLNAVENHLERLLTRHIPLRLRDGFVFHATELFNGGGKVFRREKPDLVGPREWSLERRLKVADELAAIPRKFNLPVALGWVERANFPTTFQLPDDFSNAQRTVAAHVTAFMSCAMTVEQWMRQSASSENCLLVVEDNDQARKTIRDVHTYHQDKKIESLLGEKERAFFPLRKIKEDPLFQSKRASSPLVVADFCAYVWKRILMKDSRYERFFDPFREHLIAFEDAWLEQQRKRSLRNYPPSRGH